MYACPVSKVNELVIAYSSKFCNMDASHTHVEPEIKMGTQDHCHQVSIRLNVKNGHNLINGQKSVYTVLYDVTAKVTFQLTDMKSIILSFKTCVQLYFANSILES